MRTPVKIVAWTLAFAAAAGAGAYVAAHTDPFPPGVDDPGARSTSPSTSVVPTPTSEPEPRRWQVDAEVGSEHQLHVEGPVTPTGRSKASSRNAAEVASIGVGRRHAARRRRVPVPDGRRPGRDGRSCGSSRRGRSSQVSASTFACGQQESRGRRGAATWAGSCPLDPRRVDRVATGRVERSLQAPDGNDGVLPRHVGHQDPLRRGLLTVGVASEKNYPDMAPMRHHPWQS